MSRLPPAIVIGHGWRLFLLRRVALGFAREAEGNGHLAEGKPQHGARRMRKSAAGEGADALSVLWNRKELPPSERECNWD